MLLVTAYYLKLSKISQNYIHNFMNETHITQMIVICYRLLPQTAPNLSKFSYNTAINHTVLHSPNYPCMYVGWILPIASLQSPATKNKKLEQLAICPMPIYTLCCYIYTFRDPPKRQAESHIFSVTSNSD